MESNGLTDFAQQLFPGAARSHAPGQVRHVGGIVIGRFFDHDGVFHCIHPFSPDCFTMLAHVPAGRSSPGFPGMVTVPGLTGCRYWRWLPLVRTMCHPSRSMRRMASLTLGITQPFRVPLSLEVRSGLGPLITPRSHHTSRHQFDTRPWTSTSTTSASLVLGGVHAAAQGVDHAPQLGLVLRGGGAPGFPGIPPPSRRHLRFPPAPSLWRYWRYRPRPLF